MKAGRMELDPCGQELRGSTIAGEISSVNHTAPGSSEGIVRLSDDPRRESQRAADIRYHQKRKRNEDKMMEELKKLEEYSGKLEDESRDLKNQRNEMKARVDERYNIIHTQLVDNYAGQNTEVQKINFIGETSTGQDGLNEMNQAPNTSNADTIPGENASMNLQTPPRSAQPAGSSGLPDDKRARKNIAEKNRRDDRKGKINAVAARIKKLEEKNAKMESDNAVLKAEANLLEKQLGQLRDISKKMASKDARRNTKLEKVLDGFMHVRGTTGLYTGETGLPVVHHPTINQSGATMEPPGPVIAPSLPQLHQVEGPYQNNVEQPPLNYGGLTHDGDLFGSHGLNDTSSPRATMASGSSLVEALLAPGGQLPSFGSTSFNEDFDWLLDGFIASVECRKPGIQSELEPPSHD